MLKFKYSEGFSIVETTLAIFIICALVLGGWWVYAHRGSGAKSKSTALNTNTQNTKTTPQKEQPVKWVTYKNDEARITFQYPDNWTHKVNEALRSDAGDFWGISGTVTSPTGRKLEWVYQIAGGKGGNCTPDPHDVVFADGNKCSSKQILSIEKIPQIEPRLAVQKNMFKDTLLITHTKYRSEGTGGKITYQTCLDPYYANDGLPVVGESMGLLFPCQYWSTGFNVKFEVASESDFRSSETATAEKIMKSFDSF